jgi:hypothetical protein
MGYTNRQLATVSGAIGRVSFGDIFLWFSTETWLSPTYSFPIATLGYNCTYSIMSVCGKFLDLSATWIHFQNTGNNLVASFWNNSAPCGLFGL